MKLYVVQWPNITEPGCNEVAFNSLAQALVAFGKRVERYESASDRNLMIDWSSIEGGKDLEQYGYIVAYLEGGDMIADAKVWVKTIRQFNYST
jgi:hypothetical protein